MSSRVYQLIPVLSSGDGVGNHALLLHEALGDASGGFIVEDAEPDVAHLTQRWTAFKPATEDAFIYHFAMASRIGEWFGKVPARTKILEFHNYTPPEYFRAYDLGLTLALQNARRELETLSKVVDLAITHSTFSASMLEELEYRPIRILNYLIDFSRYDEPPDEPTFRKLRADKKELSDVLFVGRIAPNKRQEDLIKAFAVYKRVYNRDARLFLVGTPNSDRYMQTLRAFIDRLGVEDINLIGRVTHAELVAYYRTADLFASCSAHEGFGIPWLEAMHYGVPVVTRPGGAIVETIGDAGVVIDGDAEEFAAAIDLMMRDRELQQLAIGKGAENLKRFTTDSSADAYRALATSQ